MSNHQKAQAFFAKFPSMKPPLMTPLTPAPSTSPTRPKVTFVDSSPVITPQKVHQAPSAAEPCAKKQRLTGKTADPIPAPLTVSTAAPPEPTPPVVLSLPKAIGIPHPVMPLKDLAVPKALAAPAPVDALRALLTSQGTPQLVPAPQIAPQPEPVPAPLAAPQPVPAPLAAPQPQIGRAHV